MLVVCSLFCLWQCPEKSTLYLYLAGKLEKVDKQPIPASVDPKQNPLLEQVLTSDDTKSPLEKKEEPSSSTPSPPEEKPKEESAEKLSPEEVTEKMDQDEEVKNEKEEVK